MSVTTSKLLDSKITTTEFSVQSSSVSFTSGPHSILDVGLHKEKHTDLTEMQPNNVKLGQNCYSLQDHHNQDSPVLQQNESSDEGLPTTPNATSKRPPPLEMAQDPSLVTGDGPGPKTPLSPRTRSGTLKVDRGKKIGHRRVGEGGEVTYKKIHTTQIMGSIQLGISHAVGGLASKPERDLLMQDFMTIETTNFYSQGSQLTPAHHYSDFRFKSFAPIAFRYFRDLFGIQPDDFLLSLCNEPLRELSNPGASGSIFYLSADDEFIIKTVQHKEGEFLMKLLLGYYMNLNQNPRTLLPKFFGLYCYICNSKNVRMVVMNNLLPSSIKMHEKYDLKGSTFKRKASKSERSKGVPTYKDLDFLEIHPDGILLEADTYTALIKTIQRDCRVLESFKIMDYSLLVAVHNLDVAAREEAERQRQNSTGEEESGDENGAAGSSNVGASGAASSSQPPPLVRSRSINRQKLVAHSTALESIQAESEPIDEEDDVPPGGIPARNAKGERLLIYLGIIDILQSYRLKKKLEHTLKAMIHDGDTVSVHRPGFYSQRFQNFMAKQVFRKVPSPLKHSPSKRKLTIRTRTTSVGDGATPVNQLDGLASNQETETSSQEVETTAAGGSGSGAANVSLFNGTHGSSVQTVSAKTVVGSGAGGNGGVVVSSVTPVNLPAVLKDRVSGNNRLTSGSTRGPPPPVPPRSPKRVNIAPLASTGSAKVSFRPRPNEEASDLRSFPSTSSSSSTPPPAFDDINRSGSSEKSRDHNIRTQVAVSSSVAQREKQPADAVSKQLWNSQYESIRLSEVQLEVRSDSKTSIESNDVGRIAVGQPSSTHTPTPTWTEGTPSFTESSSSGELVFSGSPKTSTSISSTSGRRSGSKLAASEMAGTSPVYYQDHEMTHL